MTLFDFSDQPKYTSVNIAVFHDDAHYTSEIQLSKGSRLPVRRDGVSRFRRAVWPYTSGRRKAVPQLLFGMGGLKTRRIQHGENWTIDGKQAAEPAADYAVVTRFFNPDTSQWLIALSGLEAVGTQAAAERVIDPKLARLIPKSLVARQLSGCTQDLSHRRRAWAAASSRHANLVTANSKRDLRWRQFCYRACRIISVRLFTIDGSAQPRAKGVPLTWKVGVS